MTLQDPKINTYTISRNYFNWCFDNPEKIKPSHTAIYFYALDMNNRFGWKEKFRFPTMQAMETLGIKSKNTFYKSFNELIEWDFIRIITKSMNQNTANIISISAVSKFKAAPYLANTSALDAANIQGDYSGGNIDKPLKNETNVQGKSENYRAIDLIKKEKLSDFQFLETKYKNKIKDWDRLLDKFNISVDLEIAQGKLKFISKQLMPRLQMYVISWEGRLNAQKIKTASTDNIKPKYF